jgi:hypothetical protein
MIEGLIEGVWKGSLAVVRGYYNAEVWLRSYAFASVDPKLLRKVKGKLEAVTRDGNRGDQMLSYVAGLSVMIR